MTPRLLRIVTLLVAACLIGDPVWSIPFQAFGPPFGRATIQSDGGILLCQALALSATTDRLSAAHVPLCQKAAVAANLPSFRRLPGHKGASKLLASITDMVFHELGKPRPPQLARETPSDTSIPPLAELIPDLEELFRRLWEVREPVAAPAVGPEVHLERAS